MTEASQSPTEALLSGMGAELETPEADINSEAVEIEDSEASLQQEEEVVTEETEQTQEAVEVKDLKSVADAAGVDVKDLYSVEIPLGDDGSTMTLGEIKNRYKDLKASDDLLAQYELEQQQSTNDLMKREQQLTAWMQETGYQPSEQMSEQMNARFQASLATEQQLLLKLLPSWSEPSVAEGAKQDIVALMKEYGADDNAINALHKASDVKLLHDFAQLRKRVSRAKETEVRTKRNQSNRGKQRKTGDSASRAIENHKRGKVSSNDAATAILFEGMKQ